MSKFIPGFGPNNVNLGGGGFRRKRKIVPTMRSTATLGAPASTPAPLITQGMTSAGPLGGGNMDAVSNPERIFETVKVENPQRQNY